MRSVTAAVGSFDLSTDKGLVPIDGVRVGPFIIHDAPIQTAGRGRLKRDTAATRRIDGRYGVTHFATGLAMLRCSSKHTAFAFCERVVALADWSLPRAPELGEKRPAYVAALREAEAA